MIRAVTVVALRKESVDRNAEKMKVGGIDVSSLSARRAWIEIARCCGQRHLLQSLSARRAWIEISFWYSSKIMILGRSPQGERG